MRGGGVLRRELFTRLGERITGGREDEPGTERKDG